MTMNAIAVGFPDGVWLGLLDGDTEVVASEGDTVVASEGVILVEDGLGLGSLDRDAVGTTDGDAVVVASEGVMMGDSDGDALVFKTGLSFGPVDSELVLTTE